MKSVFTAASGVFVLALAVLAINNRLEARVPQPTLVPARFEASVAPVTKPAPRKYGVHDIINKRLPG
ncbi:MAG: hypothetical protein ABJB74_20075 [Gemmatimonas sp.]